MYICVHTGDWTELFSFLDKFLCLVFRNKPIINKYSWLLWMSVIMTIVVQCSVFSSVHHSLPVKSCSLYSSCPQIISILRMHRVHKSEHVAYLWHKCCPPIYHAWRNFGEWPNLNQLEGLHVQLQLYIKISNWQVKHCQMAFYLLNLPIFPMPNISHVWYYAVTCVSAVT